MQFQTEFDSLLIEGIHDDAQRHHDEGWRYVQMLAVNKDDGVDLVYSYMKDGNLENMVVSDVARDAKIPSITDLYLEAFVCENEIHDLFDVDFEGIAIDFKGNFYRVGQAAPMTVITPEQLAEREKQRKIAAAKAAKEAKAAAEKEAASAAEPAKPKSEEEKAAELEAKLAAMDPEKAAKARAALEAKAAREAAKNGEGE